MSEQTAPDTRAVETVDASGLTLAIANWSAGRSDGDIEPEALMFARHCLLDFLGVGFAGADEDGVAMLRTELAGGDALAAGPSTVVGRQGQARPLDAALINGTAAHALDFDDVHFDIPGHPTVAVLPAVLAAAEQDGATLGQVLAALVTGVEVACAVGRFMTHTHYRQGWHGTGTVGALGAAAGVARLRGLDADATARALGLTISQCGGLKSMFGTMCKPMHAGRAAYNGLLSAALAARGFTARTDMLECDQGFAAAFAGTPNPAAALNGLGGDSAIRGVLFKYHAACYGTHACIDAMLKARNELGLQAEQVERIDLTVPEENLRICDIKQPSTGLEAKFSMTMTSAMALSGVATGDVDSYSEATCRRADVVSIRERVNVVPDPAQFKAVATASIHMLDGVVHRTEANVGIAETDLDHQQRRLTEKFSLLAAPVIGDAAEIVSAEVLEGDAGLPIATVMARC
ncbi:MAG: MmgE/PrpD family protein [Pseudomonadota bacterium]